MTSLNAVWLSNGYPVFVTPSVRDGQPWWMATLPDLPGCVSDGADVEAAIANAADACQLYVESLIEDGLSVPEPFSTFSLSVGTTSRLEA